jgi:hypothetical protein
VGKNPWGTIAQDWTKLNKGQQMDFAAELELFKGLRGVESGGGGVDLRRKFGGLNRRKDVTTKKDWDAPENFDEKIVIKRPGKMRDPLNTRLVKTWVMASTPLI